MDEIHWLKNVTNDSTINRINYLPFGLGKFYELEILSTNIPYYYFKQNYIDIQIGLGLQYVKHYPNIINTADTLRKLIYRHQTYHFHPNSINYKMDSINVCMELSSHALDQKRINKIRIVKSKY